MACGPLRPDVDGSDTPRKERFSSSTTRGTSLRGLNHALIPGLTTAVYRLVKEAAKRKTDEKRPSQAALQEDPFQLTLHHTRKC
jgi:hypothetical protein